MKRERLIDRSSHRVSEFSSIVDFLKVREVPPGISTIQSGGLPIDLLVSPASSATTICFFHGAIEPHFTLPVLSGLGISGGLEANRVFISDPSLILDDELMLSWYAGNQYQPKLQNNLTVILKKIVMSLGSDRVVFFGGSGGGFAALYFAHHFEGSLAVVFNPQTSIEKYSESAVRNFAEKAFDIKKDDPDPMSNLPSTVVHDVCGLYASFTGVHVAYMQNLNDTNHIQEHLYPFMATLNPENQTILLAENWGPGHSPPPRDLLAHILNVSASANNWRESFYKLGFIDSAHASFDTYSQFSHGQRSSDRES